MKTAAIAIDHWKLPIYQKHLEAARFPYTVHPGVTSDTLLLSVPYEWVKELLPIVEAANEECRTNQC